MKQFLEAGEVAHEGQAIRPLSGADSSKLLGAASCEQSAGMARETSGSTVPDPRDPQPARRDRPGDADGHLRLRPAPLRRLHPDDAGGRHPRPRVHGRGRRGRPRRHERSRSATAWSCRSPSRAAAASSASSELWSLCDNSNPNAWMAGEALRLLAAPGCSATRTCTAAMRAARRSTCACRSPTSAR